MKIYGALVGIYTAEVIALADDVVLSPAFAHVFSTSMLASRPPSAPKMHHDGPWYACDGGHRGFDVSAEVAVVEQFPERAPSDTSLETIWLVASTIRLLAKAPLRVPAICSHSFNVLKDMNGQGASVRTFELSGAFGSGQSKLTDEQLIALPSTFRAVRIANQDREFARSIRYLDAAWFAESEAGALVATWTALESLLLEPFTNGIKKELAKKIATALGGDLAAQEKMRLRVTTLYSSRCNAAHGAVRPPSNDVQASLSIACEVFLRSAIALAASQTDHRH